ncbi:hypothetical protein O181_079176 [Austropuccinia psidii MF-1]|uniref:Reverse transcriptase Ty1/copia-type domain-containing protein n=1 Tax=Austropuccinia psidii MF-1 TaxID=1389203 RepID=A0A9Q3FFR4_9BASI|nr:hypothetical protein [Austropuccinia psidii MF-1]
MHVNNGVVPLNSPNAVLDFKRLLCAEVDIKWHNTISQIFIGSLAYLVSGSLPDLAFMVNYLALHSMTMTNAHWDILDHVVGYLFNTQDHWLIMWPGKVSLNLWSKHQSKRQGVVALSTCAVEYMALSDSTQHLVRAICQLTHITEGFNKTIFGDNQAVVQVLSDNLSRKQMTYLNCAFFFVNDTIGKHEIKVNWVPTAKMKADALTKHLSGPTLQQAIPFL